MTKRGNFDVSRRKFVEAGVVASIGTLLTRPLPAAEPTAL